MTKTKNVMKKVKRVEISTRLLVDDLFQGAYRSIFKGRGIEFSEVREYEIGDDVRTIDWNVTAKMNHPFVKEFTEERDLTIIIFFDISASSDFGTQVALKKEVGVELSASLAFSAVRNNDRVGLLLATNKVEKYIPPRNGKQHIMRLIREMIYFKPEAKTTNLGEAFTYLSKILKKRSVIFIVSDFIDDINSFAKPLSILRGKHDLIAINIHDARELVLPDIGLIELEDEESGEQVLVDTSDEEFTRKYRSLVKKQQEELKGLLKKKKIGLIDVSASEDWVKPITKFFRMRKRRIR